MKRLSKSLTVCANKILVHLFYCTDDNYGKRLALRFYVGNEYCESFHNTSSFC